MIYTSYYANIKNIPEGFVPVSISGDGGKLVLKVLVTKKLAPKYGFWKEWHERIGKVSEKENNNFYIIEFYRQVLSKLDAKKVAKELGEFGENVVLLCYEKPGEFCHRNLVSQWLREAGIQVEELPKHNDNYSMFENE